MTETNYDLSTFSKEGKIEDVKGGVPRFGLKLIGGN